MGWVNATNQFVRRQAALKSGNESGVGTVVCVHQSSSGPVQCYGVGHVLEERSPFHALCPRDQVVRSAQGHVRQAPLTANTAILI